MGYQKYDSLIHVTQAKDEGWIQVSFIKVPRDGNQPEVKHFRMTKEQFEAIQKKVSSNELPYTMFRDASKDSVVTEADTDTEKA